MQQKRRCSRYSKSKNSLAALIGELALFHTTYTSLPVRATPYRWNLRKSIELEVSAKAIWDKDPNDGVLPAVNLGNLGSHYFYLVKFDSRQSVKHDSLISASASNNLEKAERCLKQAIQQAGQNNDINHQLHFMGELSDLQAYRGDFKNAYNNVKKYYETQDSIFSQENKNKIASLEVQEKLI